jgi:N-ethylmaleimide reductase
MAARSRTAPGCCWRRVDAAIAEAGARPRRPARVAAWQTATTCGTAHPEALLAYLAEQLSARGIGFLELRHAQHDLAAEQRIFEIARAHFRGALMRNGGFADRNTAEAALAQGADAIVFGRPFIGNPDLVERLREGAELADFEPAKLYGGGAEGYTDYPVRQPNGL